MKQTARLLVVLLLVLLLVPAAHADVLWTPNNSFFERHYDDCTYLGRSYYANGAEGYVTLWDAPNSRTAAAQYENGTALHVYWLYEDWGCITVWEGRESVDGWVPMSDLVLIYDNISFEEEYGDQIKPYNGEFADFSGEIDHINFYSYPGAPEINHDIDLTQAPEALDHFMGANGEKSYISSVFVDENGLTWGYINYWRGTRNVWFCLDEPDGDSFPVREVTKVELIPAPEQSEPSPSPSPVVDSANSVLQRGDTEQLVPPTAPPGLPTSFSLTPYLLVGGVVVVTAVLLFFLACQKKKHPKN